MDKLIAPCLATVLLVVAASVVYSAPKGGIFVPRNGGYEGRLGETHVFFDTTAGGTLELVSGEWPKLNRLARLEMVFQIKTAGSTQPVEVRQGLDRDPEMLFLEEGNERIGLRVKFRLYSPDNVYHGYAMTETWAYPSGEMFVSAAAAFEDSLARQGVVDARIVCALAPSYNVAAVGASEQESIRLGSLRAPKSVAFGDEALPGRFVSVGGQGIRPVSLYWRSGNMEHSTFVYRTEKGAPTYYRWPDYLRQAFMGGRVRRRSSCTEAPRPPSTCAGPGRERTRPGVRPPRLWRCSDLPCRRIRRRPAVSWPPSGIW